MMMRPELRLHTARLRANIDAVRARIAPSELMFVMKDDAYGHGLTWATETAEQAGLGWYGSYDVRGGLEIRRVLETPARVFAWATSSDDEVDAALLHDIDLGVGTLEYLDRVIARAERLGQCARVHLKIDTGLHRNGVLGEDWADALTRVRAAENAGLVDFAGIWSHLAEASDDEDDDAQKAFLDAVDAASATGPQPGALHLTASAASWWRPELRGSLSRIGAFCYGIRSADGPELEGVTPAADLVAFVTEVEDDRVTLGIGAFDGLPSTLVGVDVGTPAGLRPLTGIGATSAEVRGWPGVAVGDEVRVFGAGDRGESNATTLAERIGTVGEEILTRLTSRVRRVIVDPSGGENPR
ncbi:alanine racemase [Microbacterium sp. XT11]|uniref:alanine racemase n=1 Tax=Microbacterium sp. XT11 TaxID=367477 RepID=UPI001E2FB40D|nr:alanine racemase [Microbacterium sp. XT11]